VVLKEAHRRARIQMSSILASLVIFVLIVEILKRRPGMTGAGAGEFEVLRIVFYAIAISMVFAINLVHGFMLKSTKTDDITQIAAKLTTITIVMSALSETPLILGFVLFLGWGYNADFYILGFVSLYLMIRHFPYYGQWEKFARSRLGARWPAGPVGG
jgi:hypothetical protein